jgi:predicted nucleotidyltransferase
VAIRAAATAVGAENVRVFGSVAPGGTPESDIDLLVDFPAGERGLFPLLTMVEEVEQLLGRPVESWGDRDGSSPATRSRAAR